ncbi:hypothetical protein ACJMK2_021613 [Sinanodonta woodiana]|uniref:C-type lectin domain-containing protein n=1 Tax=Sinanodonta woodiana TaxID=1069815 RepID=A0ABD3THU2_SINWO
MNLVQMGFLSLTLLALANGFTLTSGVGFGGISSIIGILLLLIFLAALAKRTSTNIVTGCPANYTQTPNDPTTCIRFVTAPTKTFDDADTTCVNDGGYLLELSTATFPFIQRLARNNLGACSYWVSARESYDGDWFAFGVFPIPNTPGIFFLNPTNNVGSDCGLMSNADNFFLLGTDCTELHCYICQKDI